MSNELIKGIREAYAKEEGYASFASMASNVNIVPRDISVIAKRYAEAVNKELQTKYDNILATEDGHTSQTENVWQSGYAAGYNLATEQALVNCKEIIVALRAKCERYEQALKEITEVVAYPNVVARQALEHSGEKEPTIPQQGAVWVKGAPKEMKPHYAKVPSRLYDHLTYKAIIIPKETPGYWWAVGDGFSIALISNEIIEHLDESGEKEVTNG